MKVNCDKCNKLFKVMPKQKKHGQGLKETYFTCPYCEERYTGYITDKEIRKWQREVRELRENMKHMRSEDEMDELFNKIRKVESKIENRMNVLKDNVLKRNRK